MAEFTGRPALMAMPEAKHIIRLYNKIASALMEFELRWYQKWV